MPGELEEFLRRAAQRRAAQNPPSTPSRAGTPGRPAAPSGAGAPSRPGAPGRPLPPAGREVVEAVIIEDAEPVHEVSGDDIARQVAQHLDTRDFDQRAGLLGEGAGIADDLMQAHLNEVFDHQIGKLSRPAAGLTPITAAVGVPVAPSEPLQQLAAMLQTKEGFRQAILASEILNRPEHRW